MPDSEPVLVLISADPRDSHRANEAMRIGLGVVSGEDAHLFTAERRDVVVDGIPMDLGLVGDVARVEPAFVQGLLDDGLVPVVSSVARGDDGAVYNVNADTAAAALAVALGAEKLVVLTDVINGTDRFVALN